MQIKRMLQTVVLMTIVVLAASCAATKEYTSKLFKPKTDEMKDSQAVALRFLELDKMEGDKENWVSTDIIMGRDTMNSTAALDKLAKTFPAKAIPAENSPVIYEETTTSILVNKKSETKPSIISETVIKKSNSVKEAETKSSATIADTKPTIPAKSRLVKADQPVAKNFNAGEVRNKKTREK